MGSSGIARSPALKLFKSLARVNIVLQDREMVRVHIHRFGLSFKNISGDAQAHERVEDLFRRPRNSASRALAVEPSRAVHCEDVFQFTGKVLEFALIIVARKIQPNGLNLQFLRHRSSLSVFPQRSATHQFTSLECSRQCQVISNKDLDTDNT